MSARALWFSLLVLVACSQSAAPLHGQENVFEGPGLAELRSLAASQRGALPSEIRVARLSPFRLPLSRFVVGLPDSSVSASYPVFQVVFSDRWLMVDAAVDSALSGGNPTFRRAAFDSIQLALRHSAMNVITHEHHDHIGGIVRAIEQSEVRRRTQLTATQWSSLRDRPNHPLIRVDSSAVADFTIVADSPLQSIAPGVVLIRAAGHTSGSQAVYVRLSNGTEFVIAGDIAWHGRGIQLRRQKPVSMTRGFGGEDTLSIARQLDWLASLAEQGVTVIVSHDDAAIDEFTRRALLRDGLRLPQ